MASDRPSEETVRRPTSIDQRRPGYTRRSALKGIGVVSTALAAGLGTGTVRAQTDTNTLIIRDPDGSDLNDYSFSVTGSVDRLDDPRGDDTDGSDASGTVAGGADGYSFTGEVATFSAEGEVEIELNGESVTADELTGDSEDDSSDSSEDDGEGPETRTLLIDDPDNSDTNDYLFTVSGELARRDDPRGDDVDGNEGSGTVAGGTDGYSFTGDLTSFTAEGEVDVTIDGETVDIDALDSDGGDETDDSEESESEDSTLRVTAVGESARYEVTVSGDLTAGEDFDSKGDSIEGSSAAGTIGGNGTDDLQFTGEIIDFGLEGPADVEVNGEAVDPDSLGSESDSEDEDTSDSESEDEDESADERELRVNALGESAVIMLTVSGALSPGDDYDEGTDEIDGSSAVLTIGGSGTDNVYFDGEITDFSLEGPADVFVDGEQVDSDSLADGTSDSEEADGSDESDGSGDTSGDSDGQAIFIFDDGADGILYEAKPVLDEFGFVGTASIITGRIKDNDGSGYLTVPEMRELTDDGWEMCSHTQDHDKLTNLSLEEVELQLRESAEWLDERGFETDTIVYPKAGGSDEIDEIAEEYYDIGYGGGGEEPPDYDSDIRIGRYASHKGDDVTDAIAAEAPVDGIVPIMLHDVVAEDPIGNETSVAKLREICEAVDDAGLTTITASEFDG